jgi:hypothetical protein
VAAKSSKVSVIATDHAVLAISLFRCRVICGFAKNNSPLGSIQHDSMVGIANFGAAQSLKCQLFLGNNSTDQESLLIILCKF